MAYDTGERSKMTPRMEYEKRQEELASKRAQIWAFMDARTKRAPSLQTLMKIPGEEKIAIIAVNYENSMQLRRQLPASHFIVRAGLSSSLYGYRAKAILVPHRMVENKMRESDACLEHVWEFLSHLSTRLSRGDQHHLYFV